MALVESEGQSAARLVRHFVDWRPGQCAGDNDFHRLVLPLHLGPASDRQGDPDLLALVRGLVTVRDGVDAADDLLDAGRLAPMVVVEVVNPVAHRTLADGVFAADDVHLMLALTLSPRVMFSVTTILLKHSHAHRLNSHCIILRHNADILQFYVD